MKGNIPVLVLAFLAALLSGCGAAQTVAPTSPQPTRTLAVAATQTPENTRPASRTPAPTITATSTPSPTPVPTYGKLRGEVIVEQAVCHYGPGAPYLYKYGVIQGSNLEIIGRVDQENGVYLEVQAIRGNNPCWINAKWMKVKGDLATIRPVDPQTFQLPMSPYYGPLTGVSARRDGNQVTVFWNRMELRPGDDSEQLPYLIEAWVCRNGQIVFAPSGTNQAALRITDEPGCAAPSHGRVYAAEKHGYTRAVEIPWPPAVETPTP